MSAWARGLAIAAFVAIASGGACAGWLAIDWNRPHKGYAGEKLFEVPRGAGAGVILDRLCAEGVARSRMSLKLAFAVKGRRSQIKAGMYRFDRPMTPLEVLEKLLKGDVLLVKVTLHEGIRCEEAAVVLAEAGMGSAADFRGIFADPSPILDIAPTAESLEGYLLPETYMVDPTTDERALAAILVNAFKAWWAKEGGGPYGLDAHEVVTLASVVERETGVASERPLIAGVFANRLRIGMPLQSDPTVIYALTLDGRYGGRLTSEELRYESPYNTYLHRGLPAGPICNPGKEALLAALNPLETEHLYFVSQNDGSHHFSPTLAEHNRAVAKYREKVRREGRR